MDAEEAALLAAIRAAPEDDAPRLVYADWLIQRGDLRGEYIALACAPGLEAYDAARALWERNKAAWLAPVPELLREVDWLVWMDRGFPSRFTVEDGTLDDVLALAPQISAMAPVPDVWFVPRQVYLVFRDDGRAAATIHIDKRTPVFTQRIEVVALPSRRVLAFATNPVTTMAGHLDPTHGLAVHARFAGDVLLYDLRDGPTDHHSYRPQRLELSGPLPAALEEKGRDG